MVRVTLIPCGTCIQHFQYLWSCLLAEVSQLCLLIKLWFLYCFLPWKLLENVTHCHCVMMQGIKDLMEGMKDKEALIHICNTNHERLLTELERLVVCSILGFLSLVFLFSTFISTS